MPRGFADLDAVLRNGLSWPVANLAFAVIDHRGDEHFSGDTEREFALASVTKLFTDQELYDRLLKTVTDLSAVLADVRRLVLSKEKSA